ncbi:MAG: hypothetical protein LBV01_05945, partial [Deltaproteobacteria bacterium]|nr:hypothetical protein [Deltaproteobacteria bacterium]
PAQPAQPEAAPAAAEKAAPDGGPEIIAVPDQALMPFYEPDPSLMARIQNLEEAVKSLETADSGPAPVPEDAVESAVEPLVRARLDALLEPGSPFMENVVAAALAGLSAKLSGDGEDPAFRERLEKMAAAAAAKVIREEIAALMSEE